MRKSQYIFEFRMDTMKQMWQSIRETNKNRKNSVKYLEVSQVWHHICQRERLLRWSYEIVLIPPYPLLMRLLSSNIFIQFIYSFFKTKVNLLWMFKWAGMALEYLNTSFYSKAFHGWIILLMNVFASVLLSWYDSHSICLCTVFFFEEICILIPFHLRSVSPC
jgi:hypothetical protein